jgi:hypothetical protein
MAPGRRYCIGHMIAGSCEKKRHIPYRGSGQQESECSFLLGGGAGARASGAGRLASSPLVGPGRRTAINTCGGLIQNTACQPNVSVSHPPRMGPAVVVNAYAALAGVGRAAANPDGR